MIKLIHGDCLQELRKIPDLSVDMVLTDPPYGVTDCAWDNVIPFALMWEELRRITKPNSAIVLFASQPFTSSLILSNLNMFRYCWIWKKNRSTGFLSVNYRPLNNYEEIVVFSQKSSTYYPQGVIPFVKDIKKSRCTEIYTNRKLEFTTTGKNHPKRVIEFNCENTTLHPTQKPVPLIEYLIKTYTIEGETVLDFTMGSGTTGVASKNLNRNFIGIEVNEEYFNTAKNRLNY